MDLSKENIIAIGIIAFIMIAAAIGLPFFSKPTDNLMPNFALSQLVFSAVAFFIIFIGLILNLMQSSKSNAKPKIKVAFNEKGEQNFTLTYKDNKVTNNLPSTLWLINEGNAVARYFQIVFIIPENVGKTSTHIIITRDNDNNYISSHTNDGKYTLFVKNPYQPLNMNCSILNAIDKNKCINYTKSSFTVKYRIYGDWNETREGKLTIRIQKETGG